MYSKSNLPLSTSLIATVDICQCTLVYQFSECIQIQSMCYMHLIFYFHTVRYIIDLLITDAWKLEDILPMALLYGVKINV